MIFILIRELKQVILELKGTSYLGYYYTTMYFGEPPQEVTMIMDTGSHMTITPCQPCVNCGKKHSLPIFDPKLSKTFVEKIDKAVPDKNFSCLNKNSY